MPPIDGVQIDDDPARVDVDAVWAFLSADAYWGKWRTRVDVEKQISGAWRVVGAYADEQQVGFARAVSDGVALAYLADLYVLPEQRGRGVAAAMVKAMIDDGPGAEFRWMLHTLDAHGLYEPFGFAAPNAAMMERPSAHGAP